MREDDRALFPNRIRRVPPHPAREAGNGIEEYPSTIFSILTSKVARTLEFARSEIRFWKLQERSRCCRFCSGQSTNDQQGSTGDIGQDVSSSIDCTYFQGFN